MGELLDKEWSRVTRDLENPRWGIRTPMGSIAFLNTLVTMIAAHWGVNQGVHVHPDGVLGGQVNHLRHFFLEPNVLEIDGMEFEQIELQSITSIKDQKFDVVVATLPLVGPPGGRNRRDELVEQLVRSASLLSADGVGAFLVPSFYRAFRVGRLTEGLAEVGVTVHGLVNVPPRFLPPFSTTQPLFVVVSRREAVSAFALDCKRPEDLSLNLQNSLNHLDTGDLTTGIEVQLSGFRGFEHWYAQRQIDSLKGDYTRYEKFQVRDLALFVNVARTGDEFEDLPNSIYLPMIGSGPAVANLAHTSMKHQNYAQIVVDVEKATPEFLCSFVNTRYFRLYLEAEKLSKNQVIPRLNRDQVLQLPIALPDLATQERISNNIRKLAELRSMVDDLAQNISLNPVSSTSMTQQVDDALAVFGRLSAEDQVVSLLRQGESKTVEFKQTFSLDIEDNQKKSHLEDMAIKTIAAFLNSDGGDLLIGVSDDGTMPGVNFEIGKLHKSSRDEFLKHFKNRFKSRIGEQFYPIVEYGIVDVGEKAVFRVNCKPSDIEVFVDGKDFYVRTNPATDRLDGPKLLEYVKQRFQQQNNLILR